MAFDKVKTLRAAEKHLEMGKIPAAIKEYCKIVESEPDDFTTLNILGDLHARVGNQSDAISCFHRIADHYREQDFALKAIAMFRKIDRLKPNDVGIATSLAELYAQQDLVVEARAYYLIVVNAHAKTGATQAGLEVLRKIADLDPQNTEVRIKLADSYLNEGMTNEAASSLTQAGQNLLARGALDEALEVFAKSLTIEPGDRATLNGLLAAHSARGTADEAAEVIAHAAEANPDDTGLHLMLAQAYLEAEDPELAEKTVAELITKDKSTYLRMVDVAHLYLQSDKVEDAVRVINDISEQMLAEREESQLLELVNELLASDSENVQALRLLVRAYWWQRDVENLKAALERLAEAGQAAGLEKDERYALTQLTRLAPEQTDHVERLNELGGAENVSELFTDFETVTQPTAESAASSDDEFAFQLERAPDDSEIELNSVAEMAELGHPDEMEIERGFAFEAMAGEDRESGPAEAPPDSDQADADRHASLRAQELESVDFYITQGYADIAADTLNLLEKQFGKHADIERRRQQLASLTGEPTAIESEPLFSAGPEPPVQENATSLFEPIDAPSNAPVLAAQVIDPGLAEIFEEYRASAEGESNGNGDYETHYNLGLAYKEMDLFEEALEEFQIAAGLVSSEDGTPRYLQCCNLIGHCFLQKGVPQLAVKWFNKGLNVAAASEDERQALRFDLAAAYEQAGELNRAVDLFTEIYGVNVSYRGVNERLRALQSRIAQ